MTDNPKFDLVNAKLTAKALLGPDFPAYWQALGCFVDRFTGVELNLQTLLWLFAGFIPVLLMGGMVGRVFREFAVTVAVRTYAYGSSCVGHGGMKPSGRGRIHHRDDLIKA